MSIKRKLFGGKEKGYKDTGIIGRYNGKAMDANTFIIPTERLQETAKLLAKEKIQFELQEIWK